MFALLTPSWGQDCDENMLMFDCDGQYFCNNEPGFGFDCYVYNEYCEDFNGDGITDAWVGDGWCDDGEWDYDFQCLEYSFDCGDCGDEYTDYNGYCNYLPQEFIFMHEGETRQYILYIPESLPANAPLIFLMHGFTGSAIEMYNYHHNRHNQNYIRHIENRNPILHHHTNHHQPMHR